MYAPSGCGRWEAVRLLSQRDPERKTYNGNESERGTPMSERIIFGIGVGAGRVPVKGQPTTDEFELASALYTLLRQASENGDLADGGLKGAVVGEPRLTQGMNYQSENLPLMIGGRRFRIIIKTERG
jgi:hypothetical protein